ncbi:hypothetical protein L3D_01210 [Enterococcus faecalis]|nr:hypothetical protein L3D_01210 [Enterococcus faecalis]
MKLRISNTNDTLANRCGNWIPWIIGISLGISSQGKRFEEIKRKNNPILFSTFSINGIVVQLKIVRIQRKRNIIVKTIPKEDHPWTSKETFILYGNILSTE